MYIYKGAVIWTFLYNVHLVAGVQIIIATPGRFNDLVERSVISLRSVTYLVLDEADRYVTLPVRPDPKRSPLFLVLQTPRKSFRHCSLPREGDVRCVVGSKKHAMNILCRFHMDESSFFIDVNLNG